MSNYNWRINKKKTGRNIPNYIS